MTKQSPKPQDFAPPVFQRGRNDILWPPVTEGSRTKKINFDAPDDVAVFTALRLSANGSLLRGKLSSPSKAAKDNKTYQ